MPRSELSEKFAKTALSKPFSVVFPRSTHIHHARHIVFNRSLCPLSLALSLSRACCCRKRERRSVRGRAPTRPPPSLCRKNHTHINMHSAAALLTRTMRHHKYYYSVKARGEKLLKKKKKKKDRAAAPACPS